MNGQKPHWCLVLLCFFHKSCVDSSGNLKGNPNLCRTHEMIQSVNGGEGQSEETSPGKLGSTPPHYSQAGWGEGDKRECWPCGSEWALLNHWALNTPRTTLVPIKSAVFHPPQSNRSPHPPNPTSTFHSLTSCDYQLPLSAITMNHSEEDVASVTWPDPLWATGDYLSGDYLYSNLSVPQGTYPDHEYASGYTFTAGSVPDRNAADDAAFPLVPPQEMGAFPNLSTQVDSTSQVSSQCVETSTWTYPAVPQSILDRWSMPDPGISLSCIYHYPSYSPDANPKCSSMRTPRLPRCRRSTILIGRGSLPWPPTRRPRHRT